MSGQFVEIDTEEFESFFNTLREAAQGGFKKELEEFLDAIGNEFLRVVQDEIKRRQVMDSRFLLASFEKGAEGNVWVLNEGGLTLEVGSGVEYAAYVNDGHWTNPKGVEKRFVPGDVTLDGNGRVTSFKYNPGAKTGIMLKQQWIKGQPYFDSALRIIEKMFPDLLERKLQEWIDSYFSG